MDKSGHFDPCIRRQACLSSNFKTCLSSSGPKAKGYESTRSLALLPALVFTTMAHSFRLNGGKNVVEPLVGEGWETDCFKLHGDSTIGSERGLML